MANSQRRYAAAREDELPLERLEHHGRNSEGTPQTDRLIAASVQWARRFRDRIDYVFAGRDNDKCSFIFLRLWVNPASLASFAAHPSCARVTFSAQRAVASDLVLRASTQKANRLSGSASPRQPGKIVGFCPTLHRNSYIIPDCQPWGLLKE